MILETFRRKSQVLNFADSFAVYERVELEIRIQSVRNYYWAADSHIFRRALFFQCSIEEFKKFAKFYEGKRFIDKLFTYLISSFRKICAIQF